jgi:hypothetical protein
MSEFGAISELVERAALELVHKHSLDEIETILRSSGVGDADSEKLVLFIPSAFAAEYCTSQGIEFPDHFLIGEPGNYTQRDYGDEPIYLSARTLAREWHAQGRKSLVLRVLDWSAEANAIKEANAKGLTPTRMSAIHHGISA